MLGCPSASPYLTLDLHECPWEFRVWSAALKVEIRTILRIN